MLSISEFSEMCLLSPQTLRHYHSEGLLVPAGVDERTGYRSYLFAQVEKAVLITLLRGAGMSVRLVRQALDEPDLAPALLRQHTAEVERARREQDEALREAAAFLAAWPEPAVRRTIAATVVSRTVPATGGPDWADTRTTDAAIQEITEAVRNAGAEVSGAAWRALTPGKEPAWVVSVPFTGDPGALSTTGDLAVRDFPPRDELAIRLPGRTTTAKYATALARLTAHPMDDAYVDVSRLREILHDDHVETAVAIRCLDEEADEDRAGYTPGEDPGAEESIMHI